MNEGHTPATRRPAPRSPTVWLALTAAGGLMLPMLLPALAFAGEEPNRAAAPITAAAFSPDRRLVVLGSQRGLEFRTWPELATADFDAASAASELSHIHDLKFSPDGQYLLAAGGAPAEEGAIEVLRWPQCQRVARAAGHGDLVYRVAWSADGRRFASAGADAVCQVFAAQTGEPLAAYRGHSRAVLGIAFLPDGATLASVGADNSLRLSDGATARHLRTLDNHLQAATGVYPRPAAPPPADLPANPSVGSAPATAAIVATIGDDRTVRFWQPAIGRLVRFARLPVAPRAAAWPPDGARLFVGCNDGRVRAIDPDTAAITAEYPALAGRIHELLFDDATATLLVAGETGCAAVAIGR